MESKLASSADTEKEAGAEAENGHVPEAAGAGDMNNNCGGIVQVYWDRVLDLALDPELEIRQNALKVSIQHPPSYHMFALLSPLFIPLAQSFKSAHHLVRLLVSNNFNMSSHWTSLLICDVALSSI